jgi:hypothetical protein
MPTYADALQVVFALLGCEPIKCGIVCLDLCFREFIDRSVPNANASAGSEVCALKLLMYETLSY